MRLLIEVYIVYWLLKFGADAWAYDRPFRRTAQTYARDLEPERGQAIRQLLARSAADSHHSHVPNLAFRKLIYTPPPHGFEEFFAKIAEDPLVVENRERFWLHVRGRKCLRKMDYLG
eukprot:Skav216332  [mRNA]  locus=scaffold3350:268814:269164:+ [translate_table: standard]